MGDRMMPGGLRIRRTGCSGSSVFEVLIGFIAISLLLVGLSSANIQVRNTAGRLPAVSQAAAIASSYLAEMAFYPWSDGPCRAGHRSAFTDLACFDGLVELPHWANGEPMAGMENFLVRVELNPDRSDETVGVVVTVERVDVGLRWRRSGYLVRTP